MRNTAVKERAEQEDVDSDYLFGSLSSLLPSFWQLDFPIACERKRLRNHRRGKDSNSREEYW